uniref:Pro-adrenomedullin n=1 Tax=Taeniopygia guttata TaxID=59729 RepID=A0A674H472_TAEGU
SLAHRVPSSGPPLRSSHALSLSSCSNREDAHIRVKRYRQSINRFPHFQTKACRFGTCTVHWLVDELHRAAVNDRNDAAPPNKISPQGYGRRRRSLPERRSPAHSPSSGRRPRTRRALPLAAVLGV